uniref:Chitin-binding type-2 domain-containing protein n=1 Tax=Anopheles christyi TaxID=43041 RepID=A0A182K5E4_9DIPT
GNGDTCSFLDGTCVGRPDGVIPHPEGCALFLLCTSGTTAAFRCPEGEILHPEFLVCASGNADDCSLSPVTTEPPIISLCWEFVFCSLGSANRYTCPMDEIWWQREGACLPGSWDTCELLKLIVSCQGRLDGL